MGSVLRRRHSAGGMRDRFDTQPLMSDYYERFEDYVIVNEGGAEERLIERTKHELVARAIVRYDDDEHHSTLVECWTLAFPGAPFPPERKSDLWAELGFQGKDPITDLRGAGHLGLHQLTRALVELGPTCYQAEVGADFPLALASLSCTAMLCRYLGLDRTLIVPGASEYQASAAVTRSLLLLQARSEHDVLTVLHVRLLRHLAHVWRQMPASDTKIMDFHIALKGSYTHLHRALESMATSSPWRLDELTAALERHDLLERDVGALMPFGPSTLLAFLWMLAVRLGCASGARLRER